MLSRHLIGLPTPRRSAAAPLLAAGVFFFSRVGAPWLFDLLFESTGILFLRPTRSQKQNFFKERALKASSRLPKGRKAPIRGGGGGVNYCFLGT